MLTGWVHAPDAEDVVDRDLDCAVGFSAPSAILVRTKTHEILPRFSSSLSKALYQRPVQEDRLHTGGRPTVEGQVRAVVRIGHYEFGWLQSSEATAADLGRAPD